MRHTTRFTRTTVAILAAALFTSGAAHATPSDADIINLSAAISALAGKIGAGKCGGTAAPACKRTATALSIAATNPADQAAAQKALEQLGIAIAGHVTKALDEKYGNAWTKTARLGGDGCATMTQQLVDADVSGTVEAILAEGIKKCLEQGTTLVGKPALDALNANGGVVRVPGGIILVDTPSPELVAARGKAAADEIIAKNGIALQAAQLATANHALTLNGGGALDLTPPGGGTSIKVGERTRMKPWVKAVIGITVGLAIGGIIVGGVCGGTDKCLNKETNKPASSASALTAPGFSF